MKTLEKLLALGKKTLNAGRKTMVYAAFGLASLLPIEADAQTINTPSLEILSSISTQLDSMLGQTELELAERKAIERAMADEKIYGLKQEQIVDRSYGLGDVNKDGVADERDYFDISPEQMQVYFSSIGTGLSRVLQDSSYYEAMLNPFFQPDVNGNLLWYGSADVDSNNVVDWNDYNAMQQGVQNDMADVDGDGIASTSQDQQILSDYLNNNIEYLPGQWNYLQTRDERDSWVEKTLAIDKTDTNEWVINEWISGDFATQLYFNFFGYHDPEDPNIPDKYDLSMNGRFNLPVYFVGAAPIGSPSAHGMNAKLTGDNPLNFDDWNPIEPQNDSMYVQPGGWNIPYNSRFKIYGIVGFRDTGTRIYLPIVKFEFDSIGNPTMYYQNPDLILERPEVSIAQENPKIPSEYALNQNYPNPFNPRTTIQYTLPRREQVSLDVYNIRGRKLETLVNDVQDPGKHKIPFDASKYSSGIYLYRLQAGNHTETKKMVLVK